MEEQIEQREVNRFITQAIISCFNPWFVGHTIPILPYLTTYILTMMMISEGVVTSNTLFNHNSYDPFQ